MDAAPKPTKISSCRAPKKITPRLLSVLRRLASGQDPDLVCKEYEFSRAYLNRCLKEPHIKTEYDRITRLVEQEFIIQATGTQASPQGTITTAISAEVDASILESIQKLRSIMSTSPSHQAQALAAKELLDLSQAKKRLALLDKGLEDGVEVSTDDIALLATTVADLRTLHLTYISSPVNKEAALRRFSSTDDEITEALPEEMQAVNGSEEATVGVPSDTAPLVGSYDPAPVVVPIDSRTTAALGNGRASEPAPVTGPTIDEMIGG